MIAIIPARGGSKGLPGKNIKPLNGKPLIAYTIEAAKKSISVDRVVVTTDDVEIADTARKYGAEVPFLRPEILATDTAQAPDVYLHAITAIKQENAFNGKFLVLLPTAPLRTAADIDAAVTLFEKTNATTLISMCESDVPPNWYHLIDNHGRVKNANFLNLEAVGNRQEHGKYYLPNGAIYILDFNLLKNERTYYDENTVAFIMPRERSVDIDDNLDFAIAELLLNENTKLQETAVQQTY